MSILKFYWGSWTIWRRQGRTTSDHDLLSPLLANLNDYLRYWRIFCAPSLESWAIRVFLIPHSSEDMRKNFHLFENGIKEFIAHFEVCRFITTVTFPCWKPHKVSKSPESMKDLVSRLLEWYKAWPPPEEWVGPHFFTDLFRRAFSRLGGHRVFFERS